MHRLLSTKASARPIFIARADPEDARENPTLVSNAILVGDLGNVLEKACFHFDDIEQVFNSDCDDGECDIWPGEETIIVQTKPVLEVLKKILVSCHLSQCDYDRMLGLQLS